VSHNTSRLPQRRVVTRGALVPEYFSGEVRSIHRHVINIETTVDAPVPGAVFISLLDRDIDMTAYGLLLSAIPGGLKPGVQAVFSDGVLALGGEKIVHDHGAGVWNGFVETGSFRAGEERVRAWLENALQRHADSDGFAALAGETDPNPFVARARRVLSRAQGVERGGKQVIAGLHQLVGLGIGFTPSGDDFVSGVLLGAAASAARREMAYPVVEMEPMTAQLEKTSTGGATLLRLCLAGRFPAYQLRLVESLRTAQTEKDVNAAVEDAASHGESSGLDSVTGVWWFHSRGKKLIRPSG